MQPVRPSGHYCLCQEWFISIETVRPAIIAGALLPSIQLTAEAAGCPATASAGSRSAADARCLRQEHTLVQLLGSLRQLALAPSLEKVSFAGRGFAVPPSEISERLEAVPQAVVCGFEWGISAPDVRDVQRRLRLVDPEQQGFAYEGATMAFTILDSVRGSRTAQLLSGAGERHIFLAYIGIGFAMARLPRPLWKKVLPDLTDS